MAWFMFNDAFVSIVSKDCKPSELLVRARRPGDIEKLFPKAKVTEYDRSDYQFRAVVLRTDVEAMLVGEVKRIVYNNFKNSVRDHDLHNAYNAVWGTMAKLQPKAPYSGLSKSTIGKSMLDDLFYDDFGSIEGRNAIFKKLPKPKQDAQVRKNLKKLTRGQ